jgi:hypothetical protein
MAKSKNVVEDLATTAYAVLSKLLHNGETFKKGSTVQLTKTEAAPLLKIKTIEPAK